MQEKKLLSLAIDVAMCKWLNVREQMFLMVSAGIVHSATPERASDRTAFFQITSSFIEVALAFILVG